MSRRSKHDSSSEEPRFKPRRGLRVRLWLGALAGAAVSAGALWWLWSTWPAEALDSRDVGLRLGAAGLSGLFVALLCALWLDGGIVARVRRLGRSIDANEPAYLQDANEGQGWGEFADLREQTSALIARHRQATRSAEQLVALERQLEVARDMVWQWIETERWSSIPQGSGVLQSLLETLNHGFARFNEINDQNQEAARQVRDDVTASVGDARETSEQAERGFVEATALLTSVRELERLGAEFQSVLATAPAPVAPTTGEWLEPVSEAVRELVSASADSVDELANGLSRVQEIAEQVHVLGNRATLIALNSVMAARRNEPDIAPTAEELKPIAFEARQATDRVQALARDVEQQIHAATARMTEMRSRVAERLSHVGPPPMPPGHALAPDAVRILERMREMTQDAARKAQRLSAAGEKASSAASRMVRRLGEDVRDLEGLVVRLSPPEVSRTNTAQETEPQLNVIDLEARTDADSRPEPDAEPRPGSGEERP